MLNGVQQVFVNTDAWRMVGPTQRLFLQYFDFLEADCQADCICIFKAVDNCLQGYFTVCKKGAVVCKEQLYDHLLKNFGVFKDAPIRSEPYLNPFCETLLCFSDHLADKDCKERCCEDTSHGEGDGKVAAVPHLLYLSFVEPLQYIQEI